MNAIEIRGLKKSFRGLYALDGLDMNIPLGAIYGFIGENGSGKSTTEKLLCGHLVPDSGKQLKIFRISARILIIPNTALKNRISYKSHMSGFRIEHYGICC